MTQIEQVAVMSAAWEAGEIAAKASIGEGKPFLGAFGVAEQLGYKRDSLEWKGAVSAAYRVFKSLEIYTDANGNQVAAR